MIPTREEAWEWVKEYNDSDSLRKHALAVEGVMRHFAKLKNPQEEELWGVVGLLHDLDYEKYPDQHCTKVREILGEKGVDQDVIRAVASHGWGMCSEVEPQSEMEKTLYTIDELTGLINAAALMRPSRSVMDMELKSAKKKFKDKRFAAGVDREVIIQGAQRLGMELDDVISETIKGMQEVAEAIGLEMKAPQEG